MSEPPVRKKKKRKKGRKGRASAVPAAPRFEFPWAIVAGIAVVLTGLTVWAWPPRLALEAHVRRGNAYYGQRRYPEALGEYESAPGAGPRNAGVQIDRGLARFRQAVPQNDGGGLGMLARDAAPPEGLTRAQDEFRTAARGGTTGATEDVDATLRARAAYDLGNTFFAQHAWDNAIDAYKESLRVAPGWRDPAWNLELARRLREAERERPDSGPDSSPDAAQDATQDAPRDAQDSGRDSGPDGGMDSGNDGGPPGQDGSGGDSGQGQDSGGNQGDSGSQGRDSGSNSQPDGSAARPDGQAPRTMAPLDELDRMQRSLQDEMMRRRGVTPRNPEDDRKP